MTLIYNCSKMVSSVRQVFAALYLRGSPVRVPLSSRGWPAVEHVLRVCAPTIRETATCLEENGRWLEGLALQQDGVWDWAARAAESALTVVDRSYPQRWLSVLGDTSPPAVWMRGSLSPRRAVGIVGSRNPSLERSRFAREAAIQAVSRGYSVWSGGARGCDQAAEVALASSDRDPDFAPVIVLPYGLSAASAKEQRVALSLCAPDETFSTPNAMERNRLIYAAVERCLVVDARYQEGGAWFGAVTALRRRLCRVYVANPEPTEWSEVLLRLGARSSQTPSEWLDDEESQQTLPVAMSGRFSFS
jgi:predicted Rossmann fold nucleotide-binding protein DprA/Smf involved in DNA uptake